MKLLEDRIVKDGVFIGKDIVKVDSFLNHQIDVELLDEIGAEFYRIFKDYNINKILTVEASGIPIACFTAKAFGNIPVVFAKKNSPNNISADAYSAKVFSFTKQQEYAIRVSKEYLNENDRILIIDDFLANGQAVRGLNEIITAAGAELKGVGIVIEKSFQKGKSVLSELGIGPVVSLAVISGMENGKITFGS